jgi:membrane protein DedA with SNARE-associated domain
VAEGWHALVAVVLAVGVVISVTLLSVSALAAPGHLTGEESTLLSTVVGAMVGAAASYLGGRANGSGGSESGSGGSNAEG